MHEVVRLFCDTKHNNHYYRFGDVYPAEGKKTTKARIKTLSTTENKYGKIYIQEIPESKE